jgi:hypothetical protein
MSALRGRSVATPAAGDATAPAGGDATATSAGDPGRVPEADGATSTLVADQAHPSPSRDGDTLVLPAINDVPALVWA